MRRGAHPGRWGHCGKPTPSPLQLNPYPAPSSPVGARAQGALRYPAAHGTLGALSPSQARPGPQNFDRETQVLSPTPLGQLEWSAILTSWHSRDCASPLCKADVLICGTVSHTFHNPWIPHGPVTSSMASVCTHTSPTHVPQRCPLSQRERCLRRIKKTLLIHAATSKFAHTPPRTRQPSTTHSKMSNRPVMHPSEVGQ